jgi:amino acid adenylation domain-containing protein
MADQASRGPCGKDEPAAPASRHIPFRNEDLEQSVPDRFEQQVRRYPDKLAVRSRHHAFTYSGLNASANRIAHAILARLGEGNEPVALLFDHGAPVVAAIFGALKAGKIYVPLDPVIPRSRTEYILSDTGVRLIIAQDRTLSLACELAPEGCAVLNGDEIGDTVSTDDPRLPLSPDTLACIFFTSGSTGQPKGVVRDHGYLLNQTRLDTNAFRISADDRLCLEYSCSFSVTACRIFPSLLNGAALFPLDIQTEGVRAMPDWLIEHGITLANGKLLLRECFDLMTGPGQFPQIRLVLFGGDTIYRRDVERYRRSFSERCRMVISLASTEVGTIARHVIDHDTQFAGNIVPVGRAAEDTVVLLLDEDGQPVDAGEVGEIVVKGCHLFRGYWRRPGLTEAVLFPDPAGGSAHIFHTGDLGRMLPDGSLIHLGRKDFQVKVRGYRIEVAEVERAILDLEGIREAVVMAAEDAAGQRRLVAYLVPTRRPVPTVSALIRAKAGRLAE